MTLDVARNTEVLTMEKKKTNTAIQGRHLRKLKVNYSIPQK